MFLHDVFALVTQKNLAPRDYKTEMVSPGSSGVDDLDVEKILDTERNAKYGQKIYLKLQYQQLKQAIDKKDLEGAQAVIDNLAFGLDAFQAEGVVDKPLLFVCVEAGAEQIALHLIKKGADVRECITVRDEHTAPSQHCVQHAKTPHKSTLSMFYETLIKYLYTHHLSSERSGG